MQLSTAELSQNSKHFSKYIETVAKKVDWQKIRLLIKNPQFSPNQADIQAILPTHELVIFTKFHNNWIEIVDFLLIA